MLIDVSNAGLQFMKEAEKHLEKAAINSLSREADAAELKM